MQVGDEPWRPRRFFCRLALLTPHARASVWISPKPPLKRARLLLGVCLGHQTIGQAFGGKVVRCHEIVHGKMGTMHHSNKGLFVGLPTPFEATRYHSLIIERDSMPECLDITATLDDGTIMGLQHKTLPIHGVQFHPESIASQHGHHLIQNFLDLAKDFA